MSQIRAILGPLFLGALVVVTVMTPSAALAYVGPGAGLSMIGSLIAVVGALILAILGLVLFPMRMLMKRRRTAAAATAPADGDAVAKSPDQP